MSGALDPLMAFTRELIELADEANDVSREVARAHVPIAVALRANDVANRLLALATRITDSAERIVAAYEAHGRKS